MHVAQLYSLFIYPCWAQIKLWHCHCHCHNANCRTLPNKMPWGCTFLLRHGSWAIIRNWFMWPTKKHNKKRKQPTIGYHCSNKRSQLPHIRARIYERRLFMQSVSDKPCPAGWVWALSDIQLSEYYIRFRLKYNNFYLLFLAVVFKEANQKQLALFFLKSA